MKVTERIDRMIDELKRSGRKPESIIIGKNDCIAWLAEQAASGSKLTLLKARRYDFSHRGVPMVVSESDILEVVPNAKYLLVEQE